MAAALRASMASRQEERSHAQDRSIQKPRKEEKMEPDEIRNNRGTVKPTTEIQGMRIENMLNCCIDFILFFKVDETACLPIFQLDQ